MKHTPFCLAIVVRKTDGPREKIFGQYAYESEYYTFDREYPVMKLHVGRPLLFGVQHGRVEALAMEKKTNTNVSVS